MKARLRAWLEALGDLFWIRPAGIVVLCLLAAEGAVWIEDSQWSDGLLTSSAGTWGYTGGAERARAVLGAVASSSIGVASTIFSITIAALSLASEQMGPRLLRNFVRDRRNQLALGVFVGTFGYALVVLRTVRNEQEGAFIPHAAVTGGMALALICVATLVWFVHHVATSINVERVVDAVHDDLIEAIQSITLDRADLTPVDFGPGSPVVAAGSNCANARSPEPNAFFKLDRLRLRRPTGAHDEFLLAATGQNLRTVANLVPTPCFFNTIERQPTSG